MVNVNWDMFAALPGAATYNFEMLCRHLIHRHYASHGDFVALANQPGVEFHLRLSSTCALGEPGRWFGWQCRWYDLPAGRAIGRNRKGKIEKAIATTLREVPGITDWVLWTRHPLTKEDQAWFYGLKSQFENMRLTLWSGANVEEHLAGPGELYRGTYFGELIITPDALRDLHDWSVAPVRFRWLPEAHQPVDAERTLRRMLGDSQTRAEIQSAAVALNDAQQNLMQNLTAAPAALNASFTAFTAFLGDVGEHLLEVSACLDRGDWQTLSQLAGCSPIIAPEHRVLIRRLRNSRSPLALRATNALDDLDLALALLSSINEEIEVNVVAVVADAGNGKTHLAAQITAADTDRPAGVFFQGRQLGSRVTLDSLANQISINGQPCPSIEALLAAVDAAGERARRRLPMVIDGLNEAEDPREWCSHLSSIQPLLSRYPHVLLICTLRASFIDDCLPASIRQITIDGFAADQKAAVDRYFDHYRIDPSDAELPEGLLNDPLSLRLFCEVTNHDRVKTVGIEAMPGSLSAVFDRYVDRVADRIAELSPRHFRVYQPQAREALEKIGSVLWQHKVNGIEFQRLRELIDTDHRWDCSLVRMLEKEGVLLRMPIPDQPGRTAMVISYDALAGHLIAKAIIAQRDRNTMALWLSAPETTAAFAGTHEARPPLAEDVFAALAALLPQLMGRQLWIFVGEDLRDRALLLASELEPRYLDGPTVEALSAYLCTETNQHDRLLRRLQLLRAALNHPLNAEFLDSVLRGLDVAQRDRIWTEWTRGQWRELAHDLRELEERWRNGEPTGARDTLRARWVMWLLTSTVRDMRDQATRALYWLGRNDPGRLFDLALESLNINDPYVYERVIAACYGVAMAHQIPNETFAGVLPDFLSGLQDALVSVNATRPSNDWLVRLYVQGVFLLAGSYYPDAIPHDLREMSELEFGPGPQFDPMPAKDPRTDEVRATLHMDFENYTIGRLFEDRGNYDYNHPGYQQVISQIRGTVWGLGWRRATLGAIDSSIADGSYCRGSDYSGHVERYGKKYGWIGFYAAAGQLQSRGELRSHSERLPDLGIDPSFPVPLPPLPLAMPDWATTTPSADQEWVIAGDIAIPDEVLRPAELGGHTGPWIAIGGHLETEMQAPGRRVWGVLNAVLLDKADAERTANMFAAKPYPARHWIPEAPEDYYTFAGEIPWHPAFGRVHEDDEPFNPYRRPLVFDDLTVMVEVLTHYYGWESYHSSLNDAGHVHVPSREISRALDLRAGPQLFHQYESTGAIATLSYGPPQRMTGRLIYIREDLLREYANGRELVMLWWGERLPRPFPQNSPAWLTEAREENKEVWRKVWHISFDKAISTPRRKRR